VRFLAFCDSKTGRPESIKNKAKVLFCIVFDQCFGGG
jgi:hypothetical protein